MVPETEKTCVKKLWAAVKKLFRRDKIGKRASGAGRATADTWIGLGQHRVR
jgi:hypothetical protein